MGLIRYKTQSPAGAPHDDATIWNGPGAWSALTGRFVWNHFPMVLPWAESELPLAGASDLAEVAAGLTFPLPSSRRVALLHCRF